MNPQQRTFLVATWFLVAAAAFGLSAYLAHGHYQQRQQQAARWVEGRR